MAYLNEEEGREKDPTYMSTKDLVRYVVDDMSDYVNKLSPVEFFEEGYNYWEDYFDEIVEDFKREEN